MCERIMTKRNRQEVSDRILRKPISTSRAGGCGNSVMEQTVDRRVFGIDAVLYRAYTYPVYQAAC